MKNKFFTRSFVSARCLAQSLLCAKSSAEMGVITVKKAGMQELEALAELAVCLWPNHTLTELRDEFREMINCEDAAFFIACRDKLPIGFAQCQLRHDYVEGTHSSPVGYLEGIFIIEEYRRKGYARRLCKACETWAGEKGCYEFASDCEITNDSSLRFHLGIGFTEASRIICFTKKVQE